MNSTQRWTHVPLCLLSILAILASILVSCSSDQLIIQIDSDDTDNSGYIFFLTTLQAGEPHVDTLLFRRTGEKFEYTFSRDSIEAAYLTMGDFLRYYPLNITGRNKIRYHLEGAAPLLCYDLDLADQNGYKEFIKKNISLLRSHNKNIANGGNLEQANKDGRLLALQFIDYASQLSDRSIKRYQGAMDWGWDIVSLHKQGPKLLQQALNEKRIDSTLFSPSLLATIRSAATYLSIPHLTIRSEQDTFTWTLETRPQGRFLISCATDWKQINFPPATAERPTFLLPLDINDTIIAHPKSLPNHTYVVDTHTESLLQILQLLAPERIPTIAHYHRGDQGQIIVDSLTNIFYR